MTTEYSGTGDPKRTIELLWNAGSASERPRRGPKPRLSVEQITRSAISLANAEGLAAVSMRRVADELGVGAMSLYTYVPSKAELLDLMLDTIYGELDRCPGPDDWRSRLSTVARQNWTLLRRHPWMLDVVTVRPVLGPNLFAKYEHELRAVENMGLSDLEMDAVVTLLSGFVESTARLDVHRVAAEQETGISEDEWWAAQVPLLEEVVDWSAYPLAARVGTAAATEHNGAYSAEHAFEFGLARILDGIVALIDRKGSATVSSPK